MLMLDAGYSYRQGAANLQACLCSKDVQHLLQQRLLHCQSVSVNHNCFLQGSCHCCHTLSSQAPVMEGTVKAQIMSAAISMSMGHMWWIYPTQSRPPELYEVSRRIPILSRNKLHK